MKYLVTGGAGFIGSHLCQRLIDNGEKVICIDNLLTGHKRNINNLIKNPDFELIVHDCIKPIVFSEKIDVIFHLASPASPPIYQKYSQETFLVNTIGTYQMLEIAKKHNAIFIYASTSEIYGEPQEHPQKEIYFGNVNPFGPRSCYDESKRAGEAICYVYFKKFNVDVRIMRLFNTYGPKMDINDGRVITNLLGQTLHHKNLTIYGDGKQTRSFCYISDIISAMVKICQTIKMKGEIVNLGNPNEITINELVRKIQQVVNFTCKICYCELPEDDPTRRKPDISKAKKILNWEPKISLNEGLSKTWEYLNDLKAD